jgi:hypothetical protein
MIEWWGGARSHLGRHAGPDDVAHVTAGAEGEGSVLEVVVDVEEIGPAVVGHGEERLLCAQTACCEPTQKK